MESSGLTPSTTQGSIRESIRTSNRAVKGSCSLYMDLTLRQELERIAENEKTSFSGLVSAICGDYLKKLTPEPKGQTEKPRQSENPQPQDPISSDDDRKFLADLKKQWPTLSKEQKEAHNRYIAKTYGPVADQILSSLIGGSKP